jgi:hypothetical protein
MLMFASPEARASAIARCPSCLMYRTSVKPSPRRRSSATYCGAWHMLAVCKRTIRVVSGGASASAVLALPASAATAAAAPTPRSSSRRLIP